MSSMHGKVAVVTGAGSGIGRELAVGLAARGAKLAVADVNDLGLAETTDALKLQGTEVLAGHVDVSSREAVEQFADEVVDRFGVVHQVFNNAGIGSLPGSVIDSDWANYERVMAVNLWGVIYGSKVFLPHLIASGDGHLVNISSLNGIMGQAENSAYCASKFAVRGFTESLRSEMIAAGHPVKVLVVHPGGVRTNIASAVAREAARHGKHLSADQRKREAMYNEKLLTLPADTAAEIILDAVESNKARVLVGRDAKVVDTIVRLLPGRAPGISVWLDRKAFEGRR